MSQMFLNSEELAILTGRKNKSNQIQALRKMGITFFVNACGRPVVTRAAVEGTPEQTVQPMWSPPPAP